MTPRRIVSLVPSETFNVARLGAIHRLVGRTRYCVEPPEVATIPTIGGTKDVSFERVCALAPDLVLANREENRHEDVEPLIDAGLNVRVVFPTTVQGGLLDFEQLAELLHVQSEEVAACRSLAQPNVATGRRCFVAIWRDPWITVNDDTYIGDVIRWLGWTNVFGACPSEDGTGRDTRYPRVGTEQIVAAQPEVVLLPDEPYAFGSEHREWFRGLGIPAARDGSIYCVSGRDFCWHGAWALGGLARLRKLLGPTRP